MRKINQISVSKNEANSSKNMSFGLDKKLQTIKVSLYGIAIFIDRDARVLRLFLEDFRNLCSH